MESAGRKKYEELTKDKKHTRNLELSVWICLLIMGAIVTTKSLVTGIVLMLLGVVVGLIQMRAKNSLKHPVPGEEEKIFFEQLGKKTCVEYKKLMLVFTEDYILSLQNKVEVYKIANVEKVEVGIRKNGLKPFHALFVSGADGERHQIAISYEEDGTRDEFEKAYQFLNKKVK